MMMLSVESQVCISLFNYIKLLTPNSLKVSNKSRTDTFFSTA